MAWGRQGDVSYVPHMLLQPVAAHTVAEALVDAATGPDAGEELPGPPFPEIAGPNRERLVDLATQLVARRGDPVRIEGVHDQTPDRDLFETGGLLPTPDATLAGPTFAEWLVTSVGPEPSTVRRWNRE